MSWSVSRVLALPPSTGVSAPAAPQCCAAHASEPLLAVGAADALLVYDVVSGARLLHLRLPFAPVALAYAPPCFGAASLVAALADGSVLLVNPATGHTLTVARAQPAKPRGCGERPFIVPLPGTRPRLVLGSPGRSALLLLDVDDAVAALCGGATAQPPAAKAAASSSKLRTEYKRPIAAVVAHPGAPLLYVGYTDGAVRAYDAGATGAALRFASRVDRCDASAAPASVIPGAAARTAPAITALCVLPRGAPSGFAHLLVAADASGRLAAWEASPNSGALTPLATAVAAQPGAPALSVQALFALPDAGAVAASCVAPGGVGSVETFAAGGGSGTAARLVRSPWGAPHASLAQLLASPLVPAAAATFAALCGAVALPACTQVALLLSSGHVALVASQPPQLGAATSPCLLAAPSHLPPRHFYAECDAPPGDAAADSGEAAAGAAPAPRRAFDYPPALFFCTGGLVAAVDVAAGEAVRFEEPQLAAGATPARLVRSDAQRCSLLFTRSAGGAPPASVALLRDGVGQQGAAAATTCAACSAFRPALDGAFFGASDAFFALLEPCGSVLSLHAVRAVAGLMTGTALPPPVARAELPAPGAHRLFPGGAGACVLACRDGESVRRVRLRAVLDSAASTARVRPGLRLDAGEAVLQVAWQRVPSAAGAACAVLTTAKVLITDAALCTLAAVTPASPPRSMLWVGPALLFSTCAGIAQLAWDGGVYALCTTDAAGTEADVAPGQPRPDIAASFGSAADEAPVLLAALNDRLLLLHAGRGDAPREMRLRARPVGLLQPLALGWLSLHATVAPLLRLQAALAAAAAAADGARVSPVMLRVLCDGNAGGLALALARAPGAWLTPAAAADAALASGDLVGAFAALRAGAPPAAASGSALGVPPVDAHVAAALAAVAAEALRRREPPLAWAAALLAGDTRGVLAAASSVAAAPDPAAAFSTLQALASRLTDRSLAAAAISAMHAAAASARGVGSNTLAEAPRTPTRPWALLPAPANGAVMRASGAVQWLDPRSMGAAAVAGVALRARDLEVLPQQQRQFAAATAAPRSFTSSARARSEDNVFGADAVTTPAFSLPPSSMYLDSGIGPARGSPAPSVGAAQSRASSATHDSDDEDFTPQPSAAHVPEPLQHPTHHRDHSSSSDDDELPGSFAGRPRIVVNIRAAGSAPALPPKPLPRLPGGVSLAPPSTHTAAAAEHALNLALPHAPASSGPPSFAGRRADPFAAAAAAEHGAGTLGGAVHEDSNPFA